MSQLVTIVVGDDSVTVLLTIVAVAISTYKAAVKMGHSIPVNISFTISHRIITVIMTSILVLLQRNGENICLNKDEFDFRHRVKLCLILIPVNQHTRNHSEATIMHTHS